MSTDKHWETFARQDPYWAVLTDDKFKTENLSEANRQEFFDSGEGQISQVVQVLADHFHAPRRFGVALDYGCGVGRLVLPLAARSDRAIGVDISDTMLRVCAENAQRAKLGNVELVLADDTLSRVNCELDLITSFIVFQHIPTERGYKILSSLLRLLKPGGHGFIHLTCADEMVNFPNEATATTGSEARYYQRIGDSIHKLVRSPSDTLIMQMNHYNLNEVFCMFADHRVFQVLTNYTNHTGTIGVELYFTKATD